MRLTDIGSCPLPKSNLILYVTDHALLHSPTCSCFQHHSSSLFNSNLLNSSPAIAILVFSFYLCPCLSISFFSVHSLHLWFQGFFIPLFSSPIALIRSSYYTYQNVAWHHPVCSADTIFMMDSTEGRTERIRVQRQQFLNMDLIAIITTHSQ